MSSVALSLKACFSSVLNLKFKCRMGFRLMYLDVNADSLKTSAGSSDFGFSRSAKFLNITQGIFQCP